MQAAVLLVLDPLMLYGNLQAHCQPKTGPWSSRLLVGGKPLKSTEKRKENNSSNYVKYVEPKNGRSSLNSGGQGWDQAAGPEKMKSNTAHLNAHKICIL